MITLICKTCGKSFVRERRRFQFCSLQCSTIGRKKHNFYTLKSCQLYAASHGGECLSQEYCGSKKTKWRCKEGHEWSSLFVYIRRHNCWCRSCSGLNKKTIEELRLIAAQKNIELVSDYTEYLSNKTPLTWRCKKGHKWKANANNIASTNTKKCPYCKSGSSSKEQLCREIFEKNTKHLFPAAWPKWLKSQNGQSLQLDGFCEELKIAFEYDGEFHYKPHWAANQVQFDRLKQNDLDKTRLCSEQGVTLIRIPYFEPIAQYIAQRLKDLTAMQEEAGE